MIDVALQLVGPIAAFFLVAALALAVVIIYVAVSSNVGDTE